MRHAARGCLHCRGRFEPRNRTQKFCCPRCATDFRLEQNDGGMFAKMKPEAARRIAEIEARQRGGPERSFSEMQAYRTALLGDLKYRASGDVDNRPQAV